MTSRNWPKICNPRDHEFTRPGHSSGIDATQLDSDFVWITAENGRELGPGHFLGPFENGTKLGQHPSFVVLCKISAVRIKTIRLQAKDSYSVVTLQLLGGWGGVVGPGAEHIKL